jgi:hypothetical protein
MTGTVNRRAPEASPSPRTLSDDCARKIKPRLFAYLDRLGVRDPALREDLADESLLRAHRKVAPGCDEELLRRALEELQRRFDGALARTLGLSGNRDAQTIAAARAALLLDGSLRSKTERLLHGSEDLPAVAEQLRAAIPRSTPPEAPLAMDDQIISFFFSRPSK